LNYYTVPPPAYLKPYVRCFWVFEHVMNPGGPPYIYRSIADGCAEIVFHYQAAFDEIGTPGIANNWRAGFHFQTNHHRRFITNQSFGIFGAYIYPFAVPYFFNIPADETSNEMPDIVTFLGKEGGELEEKMMLAPDNLKRIEILTGFLENKLKNKALKNHNIVAAIKHIIHGKQTGPVSGLADKFNLSMRQFDRKFNEYAGFGPKTILRLVRLHNATQHHNTDKPLTQIALECGYYDQSHFIHDLKAFTGYPPSFYFSGNAEGTEYRYI